MNIAIANPFSISYLKHRIKLATDKASATELTVIATSIRAFLLILAMYYFILTPYIFSAYVPITNMSPYIAGVASIV